MDHVILPRLENERRALNPGQFLIHHGHSFNSSPSAARGTRS